MNYCPQCGRKILDQSLGCPICNVNENVTGETLGANESASSGMSMPSGTFGSMPSYAPPSDSGMYQAPKQEQDQEYNQGFGQGYIQDYNTEQNSQGQDNQDLTPYDTNEHMSIEDQFQQQLKKKNAGNFGDANGASYNSSPTTYSAPNAKEGDKEFSIIARVGLTLLAIFGFGVGQVVSIICGVVLLNSQYPSYRSFGKRLILIVIGMIVLSFVLVFASRVLSFM